MVFSSVPVFLDPPNWQQQTNQPNLQHQQLSGGNHNNNNNSISLHDVFPHHHQLPPLPPPNPTHHANAGSSARPGGSMAERARLAKIPQPEGALKCPRCESTNTKFCYFNNYSLSQPRHFCKTCRRYWTRGGALRNVPVGGGCRRNKKGKGGNSKSSANNQNSVTNNNTSSSITTSTANESILNISQLQPQTSQFPFLASLQNLSPFGSIGLNLSAVANNNQAQMCLSSGTNTSTLMTTDIGFLQVGTSNGSSASCLSSHNENILASGVSQFAFFDPPTGLYPFQSAADGIDNNIGAASSSSSLAARVSQLAPVKLENSQLLNLSRSITGANSQENNPFWSAGSAWTNAGASDFSGLNSSTTNNNLL